MNDIRTVILETLAFLTFIAGLILIMAAGSMR